MRVRSALLSAAAVVASVVSIAALPLSSAGAAPGGPGPADQAPPQATLVRTDIFLPAPDRDPGRPGPARANCTNDDPSAYLDAPAYTGFTSTIVDRNAQFNIATAPAGLANATAALQASFSTWSTRGAPAFSVVATASGVTKQTANRRTDLLFGRTSGNALAVTYTWRWSDTGEYESDTVFSKSVPWVTLGDEGDGCFEDVVAYDLQNIATHEFGHIYGLDHPAGDRFSTMYAYGYTGETLKRSLSPSDQNGVDSLY